MTDEQKTNNDKITSEDYENLLDKYGFSSQEISPGKLVSGRVVKITPTHVLVDIGLKSEGAIPLEDFTEGETQALPQAGVALRPRARHDGPSPSSTGSVGLPRDAPTPAMRASSG